MISRPRNRGFGQRDLENGGAPAWPRCPQQRGEQDRSADLQLCGLALSLAYHGRPPPTSHTATQRYLEGCGWHVEGFRLATELNWGQAHLALQDGRDTSEIWVILGDGSLCNWRHTGPPPLVGSALE